MKPIKLIVKTKSDSYPILIGSNIIKPETGDFFIFPAMLCHSVASFKSNVERVSIAANFSFKGGKFETESN